MKNPKVLLLYKKTSYDNYFLADPKRSAQLRKLFTPPEFKRFLDTHQFHYATLTKVQQTLKQKGIDYIRLCRGERFNSKHFDLVVTVGGDGTFMEASHSLTNQFILGVNSDPFWSVGRFCSATAYTFANMLKGFLEGRPRILLFQRMHVQISTQKKHFTALNDILLCHINPGAMSRYTIFFNKHTEHQRSSGVWISTAAGSTGAILSAGGKVLPPQSKNLQYKPRELYLGKGAKYRFKGGLITDDESMKIASLMREGVMYVDGSHIRLPFVFGSTLKVKRSPHPLKAIWK